MQNLGDNKVEEQFVHEQERMSAMGVILHEVDSNTQIVTAGVLNKYGECVALMDFKHLLIPQ